MRLLPSIKDRFEQPGYAVYKNLETLLLKAANGKEYTTEVCEVLACVEFILHGYRNVYGKGNF